VTPLRVVFQMRTPVALGFPWIFFDGLLAHIALREELGERYYSLPTKTPIDRAPELPLKKWRGVYVASVSVFEPETETAVYQFYKRGDFPFPRGKIRRGSGFFKDFIIRVVYVPAQRVVFYATGELEEVERLVKKVAALGKERNVGFGAVRGVAVEEVEEEWGACEGQPGDETHPRQAIEEVRRRGLPRLQAAVLGQGVCRAVRRAVYPCRAGLTSGGSTF